MVRIGLLAIALLAAPAAARERVIVLIGSDAPHNPNVHDAAGGVARLAAALAAAPAVRARGLTVRAYPRGWPSDPAAFADAATVLWYFDGLERHPLRDPARAAGFARVMARGVGLVALHQSFTLLPADRALPLADWLGAVRIGMVDRTVEQARLTPARHPVSSGIGTFAYRDEFYPTLGFRPGVVPLLRGSLHVEHDPAAAPTPRTIAWAWHRPGGGRSVGFSGVHYLDTLDRPEVLRLVLNAALWTAGLSVPRRGVRPQEPIR